MSTAPSIARPLQRARNHRLPILVAVIVAAVAAAAMLLTVSSVLEEPSRVDLVVENPTVYQMSVRAEPADGGSGVSLGPVVPESTRATFAGVTDQGDRWRLEFSYAGIVAAELIVDRAEINAGPVVVPSSAEEVLREAGLPPSP